jgi:outer membrane receptor protein involved in Fe transport
VLGRLNLMSSPSCGTLSLLGSGYVGRFDLPGTVRNDDVQAGRMGFFDAYDDGAHGLSGRGLLALTYELEKEGHEVRALAFGGYRRLELLENFTGFLVDPMNGDRRSQHQATWSYGASVIYDAPLHRTLALRTGLGVRGDVFDQHQDHVDQQGASLQRERDLGGNQAIVHLLAGLRWRPVDSLRINAGARLDVVHVSVRDRLAEDPSGAGTLVSASPRLTLEWRAASALRLFGAYGRGYRPPEARAFTSFDPARVGISEELYDGGEPAISISDAVEVGGRWNPNRYFGTSLSGFATFIARESIFDHVSGVNLELNSTRRLGVELDVHSSPLDWLTLGADITYVDARFVDSGNPVPLAPWLVGGFRAIATHESGWRGGLRLIGIAPRPLPHGARGATMVLLDATAGYHWKWLRLDLELENVLNLQIREGEYHYASHWGAGPVSEIPVLHYVAGPPFNARLSLSAVF